MADEQGEWEDEDDWDDEDEDEDDEESQAADLVRQEEMRAAKERQEMARQELIARQNRKAREDIEIELTAVLGTAEVIVNNLLKVGRGAVIELDKTVDEPIEIQANGKEIATGEVIVTHDKLAINLASVLKKQVS